jgi:hypothetical protein
MPVAETKSIQIKTYHLRAKLPQYVRYAAVGLAAITLVAILVGSTVHATIPTSA